MTEAGPPPAAVRQILLSFDVEEFDLPREFGGEIPLDEQMRIGREGLDHGLGLLDSRGVRSTLFVTATFARRFPDAVRAAAARHEIASHGMTHGELKPGDLAESRVVLGEIAGAEVRGFRRARMEKTDSAAVCAAGYGYQSSENPIYLPGRYNNLFGPRRPYERAGLLNIPASATPVLRWPLFWLSVKNAPIWTSVLASRWVLAEGSPLVLYFHPWELCDLSCYRLPRLVGRVSGEAMRAKLGRFLDRLAPLGQFVTCGEYERRWRAEAGRAANAGAA